METSLAMLLSGEVPNPYAAGAYASVAAMRQSSA